jgi:hypothetical protein
MYPRITEHVNRFKPRSQFAHFKGCHMRPTISRATLRACCCYAEQSEKDQAKRSVATFRRKIGVFRIAVNGADKQNPPKGGGRGLKIKGGMQIQLDPSPWIALRPQQNMSFHPNSFVAWISWQFTAEYPHHFLGRPLPQIQEGSVRRESDMGREHCSGLHAQFGRHLRFRLQYIKPCG